MNGTNLFKIALRALANNKLRAFLTMLGIIIGVASVITMLAIGQGSKKSIQQQISEMGSNMIPPAYGGQRHDVYGSRHTEFGKSMCDRKDDSGQSFPGWK